jgi:hypothetical protein
MTGEGHIDQISRLRQNIIIELDLCDPIDTPNVCANIGESEGLEKIQSFIIQIILEQRVTIGEAIIIVENQLNINSYDE